MRSATDIFAPSFKILREFQYSSMLVCHLFLCEALCALGEESDANNVPTIDFLHFILKYASNSHMTVKEPERHSEVKLMEVPTSFHILRRSDRSFLLICISYLCSRRATDKSINSTVNFSIKCESNQVLNSITEYLDITFP